MSKKGHFTIIATMPSGGRLAFAMYKKEFALVPLEESGLAHTASIFDTKEKAQEYLDNLLELNPKLRNPEVKYEVVEGKLLA